MKTKALRKRINARLIEGAKLDKLARSGVTIIRCDKEPGFFIRLNSNSLRHAFYCQLQGTGKTHAIGKLDETDVDAARSTCRDWRENGGPMTEIAFDDASDEFTLDFCFDKWLHKGNKKRSERTVAGVRRDLELFSADWRDRSVTDIKDSEIIDRAESIRDGNFYSPNTEQDIGTYNVARRWLLSMSAIHNAARLRHKSFNVFEALLDDEYPKQDGLQRALTPTEIGAVLKFKLSHSPRDPSTNKANPAKYLRMLALKFQLLSGFRIGDQNALRVDDIKEHDGTRYIEHHASKGKRPHFLPMPKQLAKVIDEAEKIRESCDTMSGSEFVFCHAEGGRFSNARDGFDQARDILVDLELIKKEKVPGNGSRLIRSHDCRRTFKTYGHEIGIAEASLNTLLDHGESAMSKIYLLPSHDQRMAALARLLPDHQAITDHLYKIAAQ